MAGDKTLDEKALREIEKRKKVLETSYEMYEKSRVDMKYRRENDVDKYGNKKYSEDATETDLEILGNMQQSVVDEYKMLGGNVEDLKKIARKRNKKIDRAKMLEIMKKTTLEDDKENYLKIVDYNVEEKKFEAKDDMISTIKTDTNYSQIPTNNISYDAVPLPSKGEAYKQKYETIPVGYLTAYDENLIVSPNLYRDGTFLDHIINNKLMNKKISVDDLLVGDRDAIILFLRTSSYGPEFPVTATDNETGKQFETVVDLTQLKYKEFNLKGDEEGYFDFELPVSKDKIKFKFLTIGDIRKLEKMELSENIGLKKSKIATVMNDLNTFIENDDLEILSKKKLTDSIKVLNDYSDSLKEETVLFTHAMTNKLIASVMEVNGVTDRKYIAQYVLNMNVRDSSALRKYITENEPGIDFNITIERPESLGGGSFDMFLTLDQYIFLYII